MDHTSAEKLAQTLEQHPDFKVLRRLLPQQEIHPSQPGQTLLRGVVLDTETTGLNVEDDQVIELGMLLFEFDPITGIVYRVVDVFDQLEDPGRPIPPETTAVHHITDDMVHGKRIDDATVEALVADASLVIAHNAAFDRPFVEKRWPIFVDKQWACSVRDVDWKREGVSSAKLEYLLQMQGIFYEAHRAETDCWALLTLLSMVLPQSQQTVMLTLLESLNQPQIRLYATGSPFDSKDALKIRGYRWAPDIKCWHRQLGSEKALSDEIDWLKRKVYQGRQASVEIETMGGTIRHSLRQGHKTVQSL
ncbi:MAG: DNA polymerase III subunit epsilon [Betaproteobacteria bacterium]|nr:DNA polymerase III subunit epsilon [Betaproteobacteria bacterium]